MKKKSLIVTIIASFLITLVYFSQYQQNYPTDSSNSKPVLNSTATDFMFKYISTIGNTNKKNKFKQKYSLKEILEEQDIEKNDTSKHILQEYAKLKEMSIKLNNPNIKDDNNVTVLMYSAFAQDYEFAQKLLDMGADINAIGVGGSTALMLASLKKDNKLIKLLVENGASINLDDAYNPLLISARLDDMKSIKYLIEQGANVNAQESDSGRTPFLNALLYGSKEGADYLIKHGASVLDVDNKGAQTSMMHAVASGSLQKVKFVASLPGSSFNFEDSQKSILGNAAGYGDKELMQYLIEEQNLDVNHANQNGQTALFSATLFLNDETLNVLIEHGADINAKLYGSGANSLLAMSALLSKKQEYSKKEVEIAQILINNGIQLNVQDDMGRTALHYAIIKNKVELADLLIKNGIDVNIKDNKNHTAFDYKTMH